MKYLVWCPEQDETAADGRNIEAPSAEDAATEWAKMEDLESTEYRIANGEEVRVMVRDVRNRETSLSVCGEVVPHYWAIEA